MIILAYIGCQLASDGKTPVGMKHVGKDTVKDFVTEIVKKRNVTTINIAFADALKELIADFYGLERSVYDSFEAKETPLTTNPRWTYRTLCEQLGTNVCRTIRPKIWIDIVRQKIEQHQFFYGPTVRWHMLELGLPIPLEEKLIQVTDVRFKDEYDMLKSLGAKFVQVNRVFPNIETKDQQHVSNIFNPDMKPDHIIHNFGTLQELKTRVEKMCSEIVF